MAILQIRNLQKYFGGVAAIRDLQFDVLNGEILGLIGPNGAGKTTLFNIITGFISPTKGGIIFDGEEITGLKPHMIARKGISRTFQASTVFRDSTVLDNILTGFYIVQDEPGWKTFLNTRTIREQDKIIKQKSIELLDFTGMESQRDKRAANLSAGYQKLLAIAIALTTKPKLLLLDEPVTTLSTDKVEMVMELITRVRNAGTTVLIIEHNMKAIMDYCDRIVVMGYGTIIGEGQPKEIRTNKEVIEAYLGDMG